MRKQWTDELIAEGILNAKKQLNLERMPTADELRTIGMNDLHCKISRTKKYSGWAEELGLCLKSGSNTRKATEHEVNVAKWLQSKGFTVEQTSHKHPYDLFVDECVKIDVKVSSPYISKHGTTYIFAGLKGIPTCDIYILVTLNQDDTIKNYFVIPSHYLKQQTVNLHEEQYTNFAYDWEIVEKYSDFMTDMCFNN